MDYRITDDLEKLREILPPLIRDKLNALGHVDELLEIILDLGRMPTARFVEGEVVLTDEEVTPELLGHIVEQVSDFDADNRAGLERTLHRISAIRNRKQEIVGLTCRVGRAVYGTIDIIQDLIGNRQSILMLGPPGVGKTTMLREVARVLAEERRVVIVDTSNEIGGDGDVPHPAVGRARRMQVARPDLQHEVMIEAVENHNPEVIIIDEIGRQLEALAARTIAERGVQLVGTAHGNALDNLLLNPTLSDLVGGIESVTLSDEEARRRGTQKTVLERRAPPTFNALVEIQTRNRLVIHEDIAAAVDAALRGRPLPVEVRTRNENGEIEINVEQPAQTTVAATERGGRRSRGNNGNSRHAPTKARPVFDPDATDRAKPTLHIYVYGVARNRLQQTARRLSLPLIIEEDLGAAQMLVTLKNYYRRRPKLIVDAERRGMPIHVLRANTVTQIENFLVEVFQLDREQNDPYTQGLRETREAIQKVKSGEKHVNLQPQPAYVRRLQHEMIREAHLISHSYGKEPQRHVRVLREEMR